MKKPNYPVFVFFKRIWGIIVLLVPQNHYLATPGWRDEKQSRARIGFGNLQQKKRVLTTSRNVGDGYIESDKNNNNSIIFIISRLVSNTTKRDI